jgi:hypothetical protein
VKEFLGDDDKVVADSEPKPNTSEMPNSMGQSAELSVKDRREAILGLLRCEEFGVAIARCFGVLEARFAFTVTRSWLPARWPLQMTLEKALVCAIGKLPNSSNRLKCAISSSVS